MAKAKKVYRTTVKAAVKGWGLYLEGRHFPTAVFLRKPSKMLPERYMLMGPYTIERVTILRG